MTDDLDNLERLAREANQDAPGPYKVEWLDDDEGASRIGINRITDARGDDVVIADSGVYPPYGAVARHIAACSPPTILALIAELRALRGAVVLTEEEREVLRMVRNEIDEFGFAHEDSGSDGPDRRQAKALLDKLGGAR